ncbi:Hypothetical predicted protein, partial [Pelobates cultripes]
SILSSKLGVRAHGQRVKRHTPHQQQRAPRERTLLILKPVDTPIIVEVITTPVSGFALQLTLKHRSPRQRPTVPAPVLGSKAKPMRHPLSRPTIRNEMDTHSPSVRTTDWQTTAKLDRTINPEAV